MVRPLIIQVANGSLLVIILIGVPAITSLRLGSLQLTSAPVFQQLILGGFVAAAIFNLLGWLSAKASKNRRLFRNWFAAHSALLAVEVLYFAGHIHFHWLKKALLWMTG